MGVSFISGPCAEKAAGSRARLHYLHFVSWHVVGGSEYSASGFHKEDLVEKSTNALSLEQVAKPSDGISVIFHKSMFRTE